MPTNEPTVTLCNTWNDPGDLYGWVLAANETLTQTFRAAEDGWPQDFGIYFLTNSYSFSVRLRLYRGETLLLDRNDQWDLRDVNVLIKQDDWITFSITPDRPVSIAVMSVPDGSGRDDCPATRFPGYGPAIVRFFFNATPTLFGAYTDRDSVMLGNTISFSVNCDVPAGIACSWSLYRYHRPDSILASGTFTSRVHSTPPDSYSVGCGWPVDVTFQVPVDQPENWSAGVYVAQFNTSRSAFDALVHFVVRLPNPGTQSRIAVCVPVNTWQAYNSTGGKSYYFYSSTNGVETNIVSFDRPQRTSDGFFAGFLNWLETTKYVGSVEFFTDVDLHQDGLAAQQLSKAGPLLASYNAIVIAGHNEYWSQEMYDDILQYVTGGGTVVSFSGNTCYYRVSFDPNCRTMTRSGNWFYDQAGDVTAQAPCSALLGVNGANGCGAVLTFNQSLIYPDPVAVVNPAHTALAGLQWQRGHTFGGGFIGYELDGAYLRSAGEKLKLDRGRADPTTGLWNIPTDLTDQYGWFDVMAAGFVSFGHCCMGTFHHSQRRGVVFTTSANFWGMAVNPELDAAALIEDKNTSRQNTPILLQSMSDFKRITSNVMDRIQSPVYSWHSWRDGSYHQAYTNNWRSLAGTAWTLEGMCFCGVPQSIPGAVPLFHNLASGKLFTDVTDRLATQNCFQVSFVLTSADTTLGLIPIYEFQAGDVGTNAPKFCYATDPGAAPTWRLIESPVFYAYRTF